MTHASDTLLVKPLPRTRRRYGVWIRRAVLLATLVVLVDAVFGDRGLAETRRARRIYAEAAAELSDLQEANAGLREQTRRLTEDPAAIEDVARKELGLIRPGEVLFVVKPSRSLLPLSPAPVPAGPSARSPW
jgi:cell division protein FtsB